MSARGHIHLDTLLMLGVAGLGALVMAADSVAPDLVRHPATPTVASGLVLVALGILKLVDRVWFKSNDAKTDAAGAKADAVGLRVDGLAGRIDKVLDSLDGLRTDVHKLHGLHEEQGRQATLLGTIRAAQQKQEKDLKVLHDWRRETKGEKDE